MCYFEDDAYVNCLFTYAMISLGYKINCSYYGNSEGR